MGADVVLQREGSFKLHVFVVVRHTNQLSVIPIRVVYGDQILNASASQTEHIPVPFIQKIKGQDFAVVGVEKQLFGVLRPAGATIPVEALRIRESPVQRQAAGRRPVIASIQIPRGVAGHQKLHGGGKVLAVQH